MKVEGVGSLGIPLFQNVSPLVIQSWLEGTMQTILTRGSFTRGPDHILHHDHYKRQRERESFWKLGNSTTSNLIMSHFIVHVARSQYYLYTGCPRISRIYSDMIFNPRTSFFFIFLTTIFLNDCGFLKFT